LFVTLSILRLRVQVFGMAQLKLVNDDLVT